MQTRAFIESVSGESGLYGFQDETLESLFLTFIPSLSHEYCSPKQLKIEIVSDINTCIMKGIIHAARCNAGFVFFDVPVSNLVVYKIFHVRNCSVTVVLFISRAP